MSLIPRGNKFTTDPKLLDVLVKEQRPLSIKELGDISGMGRDTARGFVDRMILGTGGVKFPGRIVDIVLTHPSSSRHIRYVGIKDASFWNDWLNGVTQQGFQIARDAHNLFPHHTTELDQSILNILRKHLPLIEKTSEKYQMTPSKFLDDMFKHVLGPNFEKRANLYYLLASTSQSTRPEDIPLQRAAQTFLSRVGFSLPSQDKKSKEDK